jgi:hypothetical protein
MIKGGKKSDRHSLFLARLFSIPYLFPVKKITASLVLFLFTAATLVMP